MHLLRVF